MKKTFRGFCFTIFTLLITTVLFAQTPQHYNYQNVGTSNNSFPFNVLGGKMVQWLVGPGELNQPSGAPAGTITKVYFYTVNAGSPTYTNLYIRLGQGTTITTLPSGAFYSGTMDTVYKLTGVLTGPAGGWMMITLTTPFTYNPAQSLIIEVGQSGHSGSGPTVRQNGITGSFRRNWSVGGPPFVYSSQDANVVNFGVDIVQQSPGPNYIHYKFENNPSATTVTNCAIPGVGTNPAPFTVHTLGSGGQFDSCLVGTGGTNSGVQTGWLTNLGSGSWTISMWLNGLPSNTSLYYLWGEATGSFRCFLGGAAGAGNLLFRGTGITDVNIPGVAPGPTVVHIVYDSAASQVRAYKNGVLSVTVNQTPFNLATGTGFRVGGYSTSAGLNGKMDEFRVYKRKLDTAEISATWNQDIACQYVLGINQNNNQIPEAFSLSQNYPNPFNPATTIEFDIPKGSNIKLIVYDILGREVEVLVSGYLVAGNYVVDFDASNLASGVYMYKLVADGFTDTKRMLLIK